MFCRFDETLKLTYDNQFDVYKREIIVKLYLYSSTKKCFFLEKVSGTIFLVVEAN